MDDTITFYHAPQTRGGVVHWLLEEIGQPYVYHLLNLSQRRHKESAYLAVNPMGKVPAIVHREVVVTEVAAICCYLADAFPDAGLAPSIGDPRRGPYLKWLFFGPGCLEPALIDRMGAREPVSAQMVGYGDFTVTLDVVAHAVARGTYLLGEQFTAADIVIGSGLRWGMMMGGIPQRPELVAYTGRLAERPALRRAEAKDVELAATLAGS